MAQKPPARRAKPRRRSSIQAFLMRAKGEKGGDLSGTAYEGLDAADILAKQSDMLEQIQHIMIEERWQHEQHTRVLENELQSLHDIIRQHEESEVGVRPPPHPPRSSADPVCESPSRMLSSQALTPRPPPLLPTPRKPQAERFSQGKLKSKLGLALAKGLGRKKAPLAELPIGMPKKPSTDDMVKLAEVSLAEESKRVAHEFKDEARRHLERVKALEAQLEAERAEGWRLTDAARLAEQGSVVATERAQRAVQIARKLDQMLQSYAQLPTDPATTVQELRAELRAIDDEGGTPAHKGGSSTV